MADNFSQDQIQSVFGEFVPVIDESVATSSDNFQGVFGEFVIVLDEAAGAVKGTGPFTRLGAGGYSRPPYASFAGKATATGTNRLLLIHPPRFDGDL